MNNIQSLKIKTAIERNEIILTGRALKNYVLQAKEFKIRENGLILLTAKQEIGVTYKTLLLLLRYLYSRTKAFNQAKLETSRLNKIKKGEMI